jgi:hypothetical protein
MQVPATIAQTELATTDHQTHPNSSQNATSTNLKKQ